MMRVVSYAVIVLSVILFIAGCAIEDESSVVETDLDLREKIETKWIQESTILEKDVYYLDPAMKIHASYNGNLYATSLEFNKLFSSSDSGSTWFLLHEFDTNVQTVYFSPLGEMFVSIATDRFNPEGDGVIYRYDSKLEVFEEVLRLKSGAAYVWNIDGDKDGYIFVSEYGYKYLPNNARRIYRSKDSGSTWELVYEPDETDNYHNHLIVIDTENPDIVYQAIGDEKNNKLLKSDDRGKTWNLYKSMFNPISVIQTSDYLIWGTDTHPQQGIYVMDKMTGEMLNHFYPEGYAGSIYDMTEIDGKIYAGFSSYEWESQWWDGSVWSSEDHGFTWRLEFDIKKILGYGIGFYKFVVEDDIVYVNSSYYAGEESGKPPYTGTLKFTK